MRVLVTGGAGFVGSHLVERLLADGREVTVLDDLSTGSLENLAAVASDSRLALEIGSVTDGERVRELADDVDVVVHLAAAVGVRLVVERPVHTIETNIRGTEVVLEAAARRNVPVLLASTSEVYGKSAKVPFAEDDDLVLGPTVNSRWSYACSKALDEWLALAYARERGLPVIVARLFNTVGPRQTGRYGMVLPTFAGQALRGEPLTVHGTGKQTRCFAHVGDVVEALVRLLATPAAVGEVFNVGSDEEVTIETLAAHVRDAAGSASPIRRLSYEEAYASGFEDMLRRVPDVRKLDRIVGFRPRTPLATIVEDVVADQRRRLVEGDAGAAAATP